MTFKEQLDAFLVAERLKGCILSNNKKCCVLPLETKLISYNKIKIYDGYINFIVSGEGTIKKIIEFYSQNKTMKITYEQLNKRNPKNDISVNIYMEFNEILDFLTKFKKDSDLICLDIMREAINRMSTLRGVMGL